MLNDSIIEKNIQLYLDRMNEKLEADKKKINQIQSLLHRAAARIQKSFRRYIKIKKNTAASKIQLFWKRMLKTIKYQKQVIYRVKIIYSSYKIYFFLKKVKQLKNPSNDRNKATIKCKKLKIVNNIYKNIKQKSLKFMIIASSIHIEISYIKKYQAFDRRSFTQQWKTYEKQQRDWMQSQIKKKWIKKEGLIWINQHQKEINIEKYINNIIQQNYLKHHEKYSESQHRLKQKQADLFNKYQGLERAYFCTIIFEL